jgi:hypothetical protein
MRSNGEGPAVLVAKSELDLWLALRDSELLEDLALDLWPLALDFRPTTLVMDFQLRHLDLACSDQ